MSHDEKGFVSILDVALTYKPDATDAACVWEAFLNLPDGHPMRNHVDEGGVCEVRRHVIETLGPACGLLWQVAIRAGWLDSYDYVFCDWFLAQCVDPSDLSLKPSHLLMSALGELVEARPCIA